MKYRTLPDTPTPDMIEAAYPLIEAIPHHTTNRQKRLVQAIYKQMWELAPPPPTTGLTRRQAQVQRFLAEYITEHKISPTMLEIAKGCKMNQKTQAWVVVQALIRKGVVRQGEKNQRNNIQLKVYPGQPLPKIKRS